MAVANVAAGGGPFGAVVVRDGEAVGIGQNTVTTDLDPTAHAEVRAIRSAAKAIGDYSLAGCVLYASCEPCPMCMASSLWARLDRIVYAADRNDAAEGGFDDRKLYDLLARDRSSWPTKVEMVDLPHKTAPFETWLTYENRVGY